MSQTERGWADPHAVEQDDAQDLLDHLRRTVERRLRHEELQRQVGDPTEGELAAEEAQLP